MERKGLGKISHLLLRNWLSVGLPVSGQVFRSWRLGDSFSTAVQQHSLTYLTWFTAGEDWVHLLYTSLRMMLLLRSFWNCWQEPLCISDSGFKHDFLVPPALAEGIGFLLLSRLTRESRKNSVYYIDIIP